MHEGGNRTWYFTQGDRVGAWGWVPASYVNTAGDFNVNPQGLQRCSWVP
jgi:hypothetical protein